MKFEDKVSDYLTRWAVQLKEAKRSHFRIKAVNTAASVVKTVPLEALIKSNSLKSIKGIGEDIERVILEIHNTGKCAEIDNGTSGVKAEEPKPVSNPNIIELCGVYEGDNKIECLDMVTKETSCIYVDESNPPKGMKEGQAFYISVDITGKGFTRAIDESGDNESEQECSFTFKKMPQKEYDKIYSDFNNTVIEKRCLGGGGHKLKVSSNFKKHEFESVVRAAKEYIKKGDIIQVVPSQRFKVKTNQDPFMIYRALRSLNPSPYMYFLKLKELTLVGASPEMLVRCEDGVIQTRPIAGTRPRGKDELEDRRLASQLIKDKKERAEHLMLVDLGRNDLGRVSKIGTVKVSEFMNIEKYSHVMHLVSEVKGRLDNKRCDIYDVLKAVFPAGTVSGSPKIRAMEIIDELENTRRGTYAGCVGYFSFSHNMDTCITIRTILIKGNTAYVQAGGGIVADSLPEKEYIETVNKARALIEAIRQ